MVVGEPVRVALRHLEGPRSAEAVDVEVVQHGGLEDRVVDVPVVEEVRHELFVTVLLVVS